MRLNRIAAATILLLTATACTQPDKAKRVLEQAGYTDIQITGYRPFMAGKDDTFSTGFRAKGPTGKVVTGAVTGGVLKGSTIRLD